MIFPKFISILIYRKSFRIAISLYHALDNDLGLLYTSNNCEVGVIRFTYYRGLLEIMTPLNPHEGNKKLLGRLVST